jgi:hypothetical protein
VVKIKWITFVEDMFKGYSLQKSAGLHYFIDDTGYYQNLNKWMLNNLKVSLKLNDTYFLYSEKGVRFITKNLAKQVCGGKSKHRDVSC